MSPAWDVGWAEQSSNRVMKPQDQQQECEWTNSEVKARLIFQQLGGQSSWIGSAVEFIHR